MRYVSPHQHFTTDDGRSQLRYLFRLEHPVPEYLNQRLHGGAALESDSSTEACGAVECTSHAPADDIRPSA